MPSIEDEVFNMRFAAKSLVRESKKSEKESKKSKTKCKKAMEKGQMDVAKIYAQNSIRQKTEALNFLRLASRMDAVAARLQSAAKMNTLTKNMSSIVKSMGSVLETMDVEKISKVMEKFEQQFTDLDVRSEYMEGAMVSTTAMTTPEDQVEDLMRQVADEHEIEFTGELESVKLKKKAESKEEEEEEDDLSARLKKLQGL